MKVVPAAVICLNSISEGRSNNRMIITEINEATAQMLVSRPVFIVNVIYEGIYVDVVKQQIDAELPI